MKHCRPFAFNDLHKPVQLNTPSNGGVLFPVVFGGAVTVTAEEPGPGVSWMRIFRISGFYCCIFGDYTTQLYRGFIGIVYILPKSNWLMVSNIFFCTDTNGKMIQFDLFRSIWRAIFQMVWKHQLGSFYFLGWFWYNGALVVGGPVVWIPRIPLWRGLMLIPNRWAPNHQSTVGWFGRLSGFHDSEILQKKMLQEDHRPLILNSLWFVVFEFFTFAPCLFYISPALKLVFMIRYGHPRKQTLKKGDTSDKRAVNIPCWQTFSNLPDQKGRKNAFLCDRKSPSWGSLGWGFSTAKSLTKTPSRQNCLIIN